MSAPFIDIKSNLFFLIHLVYSQVNMTNIPQYFSQKKDIYFVSEKQYLSFDLDDKNLWYSVFNRGLYFMLYPRCFITNNKFIENNFHLFLARRNELFWDTHDRCKNISNWCSYQCFDVCGNDSSCFLICVIFIFFDKSRNQS